MKKCYLDNKFLIMVAMLLSVQLSYGQMIEKITLGGVQNEALVYTPSGYSASGTAHPLLVFLHGGEGIVKGLDNGTVFTQPYGPILLASEDNRINKSWPALGAEEYIVLAPHLPRDESIGNKNDQEWPVEFVKGFIDYAKANYNVDVNRIYLTGISLGAKGVWDYLAVYPNDIAAAAPISGTAVIDDLCPQLANIPPVWALHGKSDGLVDPEGVYDDGRAGSSLIVQSLNEGCNEMYSSYPLRLSILEAVGHDHWNEYYDLTMGYNIYDWFNTFEKGNNLTNKAPVVTVDQETVTIVGGGSPLVLSANAYDPEGGVLTYAWELEGATVPLSINIGDANTSKTTISGLTTGDYSFKVTVTDNALNAVSKSVEVKVLNSIGTTPAVTTIWLEPVGGGDAVELSNGQTISTDTYGEVFNIKANTINTTNGSSVVFQLNENRNIGTDASNPYYAQLRGKNIKWEPKNGNSYVITATAYNDKNPSLTPGVSLRMNVNFQAGPLPVEFYSIDAKRVKGKNVIYWKTASELNNDYFTVEKLTANGVFNKIAKIYSQGDSKEIRHYEYSDLEVNAADPCYYRVKQTDLDGKFSYSELVKVETTSFGILSFEVYPNPLKNNQLHLRLDNQISGSVELKLIDGVGVVYQNKTNLNDGDNDIFIDLGSEHLQGLYILQLMYKNQIDTRKVLID